jgi:hypothetical protein
VTSRKRRLPLVKPSALPPLYARWADELLQAPLPDEPHATCDDCAMLPREGEPRPAGQDYFDPVAKCCTYQPALPNFLVGRILGDAGVPGRASVEARIDARAGVSPLGLAMPRDYQAVYHETALTAFGHARRLRCPHHLDDGRCGIWQHRAAVCASWYCKHERGAVSSRFWRQGIEALLRRVEADLSRHCLLAIGLDSATVLGALPGLEPLQAPAGVPADEVDAYQRAWGPWLGRERELYAKAAAIVDPLSWADVLAICGPEVRLRAAATRHLYKLVTSWDLPPRLVPGTFTVVGASGDDVKVSGYSPRDPVDIPAATIALLHRFDGRPTASVRAQLEAEDGVALDDEFVRTLADFELLVEPPDPQARR